MIRRTAAAILLALAFPAAADDRVELRSGDVIQGLVESEDITHVVVLVGTDRRRLPRSDVERVVLDPALHPPALPPPRSPDAAGAPKSDGESAAPTPAPAPSTTPAAVPAGSADAATAGRGGPAAPATPPAPTPALSPGGPTSAGATPAPAAPAPAPLDEDAVRAIASDSLQRRAKALDAVVADLPRSRTTFDALVRHMDPAVRAAAVSALPTAAHPDAAGVVSQLVPDSSPVVRRAAIRVIRTLALSGFEARLIRRMQADPDRAVRIEAVRSLEDVGSIACLDTVLEAWATERDVALRPRYLRVLRRITGESAGEDEGAWREAILRARRRTEVRAPGG